MKIIKAHLKEDNTYKITWEGLDYGTVKKIIPDLKISCEEFILENVSGKLLYEIGKTLRQNNIVFLVKNKEPVNIK